MEIFHKSKAYEEKLFMRSIYKISNCSLEKEKTQTKLRIRHNSFSSHNYSKYLYIYLKKGF